MKKTSLRRTTAVLALLPLLLLNVASGAQEENLLPGALAGRGPGPMIWIPAKSMTEDLSGLTQHIQDYYTRLARLDEYRERGCIQLPPPMFSLGNPKPFHSTGDLTRHSRLMVEGRVVATEPGFYSGIAGQLLAVEILRTLKTSAKVLTTQKGEGAYLYLFYPSATFEAGGYVFCTYSEELPPLSAMRNRVLMFPYYEPTDLEGKVIYPYLDEVIAEDSDGVLWLPPRWKSARGLGDVKRLEDVVREAEESIRRLPGASLRTNSHG